MIGTKQKITDYVTSNTKTYFPTINLKVVFLDIFMRHFPNV